MYQTKSVTYVLNATHFDKLQIKLLKPNVKYRTKYSMTNFIMCDIFSVKFQTEALNTVIITFHEKNEAT